MEKQRQEMTAEELKEWLKDKRITMDCGHRFCLHPFSNTMIIHADGETECHS